jgi:glycosyltransferase involved in cell wall biosynthesis
MTDGLVSTIIPVFNRAAMLRDAVACVLAQTYRPIEIIIVDDGSTDGTSQTCRELADAFPGVVVALRQENAGPGVARETGRGAARGEFIQYFDSDDWLHSRKFEFQVAALREHPDCSAAYCKTHEYTVGEPPGDNASFRTGERLETLFPHLLSGRIWQTITPLYRRTLTDIVGPWSRLRVEEDWEYDARVAAAGARLVWVPEFLAALRHHAGERASGNSLYNQVKMRSRYEAHVLIYRHACRAGVSTDDQHMRRYARELFLLARQCGAVGLTAESHELFDLAREASGKRGRRQWDFRVYRAVAGMLGWRRAGQLACWTDRFRTQSTVT